MDRLQTMRTFVQVADSASFTKAGRAMQLPTPTVSRLVGVLESRLGARLFNRTTRSVSLTGDGERYYQRCLRVLADIDDMEAELGSSRLEAKGRLRISLATTVANSVVIPNMSSFLAQYPDLRLDLVVSDRAVDMVEEGIDCAVRVGIVTENGVVAKRIGLVSRYICASPQYIERYGEPSGTSELATHMAVGYVLNKTGRTMPWEFMIDGAATQVQVRHVITVNSADSYVECALSGVGMVNASVIAVKEHLRLGRLKRLLAKEVVVPRPINVLFPKERTVPRKTRVFIDWLSAVYAGYGEKA